MKTKRLLYSIALIAPVLFVSAFVTTAQLRLPRPSPKGSVMQTIGVTDVTITYHRPGVKGRKIWGDWPAESKGEATLDNQNLRPPGAPIVPYGHIWRTGANDATQFVVTDDVLINGQPLPAGSYSLHTIPNRDEWTIVFNGTANQWGSFNYDASKDLLRVKAKPQTGAENQEWFGFTIEPTADNAAVVTIAWEKVRVPFTVEVRDLIGTTIANARKSIASAKPDDWRTPFQAANYANQNKRADTAAEWYALALKAVDEALKTTATYPNLVGKTNILLALNRRDEALTVADKAIETGKAAKADTRQFEQRIADIKSGKQQ